MRSASTLPFDGLTLGVALLSEPARLLELALAISAGRFLSAPPAASQAPGPLPRISRAPRVCGLGSPPPLALQTRLFRDPRSAHRPWLPRPAS